MRLNHAYFLFLYSHISLSKLYYLGTVRLGIGAIIYALGNYLRRDRFYLGFTKFAFTNGGRDQPVALLSLDLADAHL